MKNFYFSLLSIITFTFANAQIINIPDANFKTKLLQASPTNYIASTFNTHGNTTYPYVSIDTNGDGEIQVSEASVIKYLNISYSQIVNLEGINNFINLRLLDCKYNQITTLDVSGSTYLEYLYCPNNQLTSLNVSGLQFLQNLNCYTNQLTNLNLNALTNLRYLFCYENQINNLNVSGLQNLLYLYCYNNQLVSLNLNGLTNLSFLRCNNNPLATLFIKTGNLSWSDLTFDNNPSLTYICADPEDISLVEDKTNQYGYTNCNVDSNCSLKVTNFNNLNEITLFPNPAKNVLSFSNNQNLNILSININNILGQTVFKTSANDATIDISNLKKGMYTIDFITEIGAFQSKFIKD